MSLTEKSAYLKGLYDGMELTGTKEARLLAAVIDVVQELSAHIVENEDSLRALADQLDDLAEFTSELEEALAEPIDLDDDEEEPEDDFDLEDEDEDFELTYEVECPNCGTMLTVGEDELSSGTITCDTCGKQFQIEIEFDEEGEMVEDAASEEILQF